VNSGIPVKISYNTKPYFLGHDLNGNWYWNDSGGILVHSPDGSLINVFITELGTLSIRPAIDQLGNVYILFWAVARIRAEQKEFCRVQGIGLSRFYYHRKRLANPFQTEVGSGGGAELHLGPSAVLKISSHIEEDLLHKILRAVIACGRT
jgi:hypothetical protein